MRGPPEAVNNREKRVEAFAAVTQITFLVTLFAMTTNEEKDLHAALKLHSRMK